MLLERTVDALPKGRRYVPYSGREPGNTLIWQCEFATLEDAQQALTLLEQDARHEELYQRQVQYFLESYTEIYEALSGEG